mgnify:FL=1|tara:strand:+ start:7689 stop:8207 length:519 start_codon:yes stop_codon:yes gene_type:complete
MGHLDSVLTPLGLQQANLKGEQLSDVNIAVIYSSDLGRCRKTAETIQTYLSKSADLVLLDGLREIDFGVYQGKPYDDVPVIEGGYIVTPFPGGESNEVMARRVISVINDIYEANKGATVLVVTHSGPISAILAAHSGSALDDMLKHKTNNRDIVELDMYQKFSSPLLYGIKS